MIFQRLIDRTKIREIPHKIGTFLRARSGWILLVIFFVFMGYCAYLWYSFVYNPKWDETKRKTYVSTKEKEAIFSRDKFDGVVAEIEARKVEVQKNIENVPDIFQIK